MSRFPIRPSCFVVAIAFAVSTAPARAQELTRASCRILEAALIDSYSKEARELRTVLQPQVTLATSFFNSLDPQERAKIGLYRNGLLDSDNLSAELAARIRRPALEFMRPVYQCDGHPELAEPGIALYALDHQRACEVNFHPEGGDETMRAMQRYYSVSVYGNAVTMRSCVQDHRSTHLQHVIGTRHRDEQGQICLDFDFTATGARFETAADEERGPVVSLDAAVTHVIGSRRDWVRDRMPGECEEILHPIEASASFQMSDSDSAERELLATAMAFPATGERTRGDAAI